MSTKLALIFLVAFAAACGSTNFSPQRLATAAALALDEDGDGVPDDVDNCTVVANPSQIDTDTDGCGNACDADYDQNGVTNATDFLHFRKHYLTTEAQPNWDPNVDMNGDGVIDKLDHALLAGEFLTHVGPGQPNCP
jgi:hypothetical protein